MRCEERTLEIYAKDWVEIARADKNTAFFFSFNGGYYYNSPTHFYFLLLLHFQLPYVLCFHFFFFFSLVFCLIWVGLLSLSVSSFKKWLLPWLLLCIQLFTLVITLTSSKLWREPCLVVISLKGLLVLVLNHFAVFIVEGTWLLLI